jgi:hypothetical protein
MYERERVCVCVCVCVCVPLSRENEKRLVGTCVGGAVERKHDECGEEEGER